MKTTLAIICICICFFAVSEPVKAGPTEDHIRMVEKREREAYMEKVQRAQSQPKTVEGRMGAFFVICVIVGAVIVLRK